MWVSTVLLSQLPQTPRMDLTLIMFNPTPYAAMTFCIFIS